MICIAKLLDSTSVMREMNEAVMQLINVILLRDVHSFLVLFLVIVEILPVL